MKPKKHLGMVKYYTLLFTEVNIWVYDTVYVHFVFLLLLGRRAEEPIHQASTEIFPTHGLDTDSAGFPRSKLGYQDVPFAEQAQRFLVVHP